MNNPDDSIYLQDKYKTNYPVIASIVVEQAESKEKIIVLLTYKKNIKKNIPSFSNLIAFRQNGELLWKAKLPKEYYQKSTDPIYPNLKHFADYDFDYFLEIEISTERQQVKAYTASSFIFDIDVLTGRVLSLTFSK